MFEIKTESNGNHAVIETRAGHQNTRFSGPNLEMATKFCNFLKNKNKEKK